MGVKSWLLTRYISLLDRQLRAVARRRPHRVVNLFRDKYLDLIVRGISDRKFHAWDFDSVPKEINGFEDLSFLFWNTPINRGMARLDFDEASSIFRIVSTIQDPHGVEIGRFAGGSTLLLSAAIGESGNLDSIDIGPFDDQTLREVLRRAGTLARVALHVADANDVDLDDDLDFVFIDGDHSYEGAKKDHLKWGAKVKVGGFILHHDMGSSRPHSIQWSSLETLLSDIRLHQANELELSLEKGSLVVFRRTSDTWTQF